MANTQEIPAPVQRVEPPCWWTGMEQELQLMIYGKDAGKGELRVETPGIKIGGIYRADSPDYLFADIEIPAHAEPGKYIFVLSSGGQDIRFEYDILNRRENSARRESFTPADMVYLIIPDRFANGAPSISQTVDTKENPDRKNHYGRHGGDLRGIIERLDYIDDLGATTLWLTPVQECNQPESSYHGYACTDYYKVDPRFGDNAIYRELVEKVHGRGLKIIMDAVPNHCGSGHWWMDNLPFRDWLNPIGKYGTSNYRLSTISDPHASRHDRMQTVNGWFDKIMPDMNLSNPHVLQYFKQLYIWWLEWADLDGLRVDTFPYNDKHAISDWTAAIRREYPNINIVAECWVSSPPIVAYWDGDSRNADGYTSNLPSVMDFTLQEALSQGLAADSEEWDGGMNKIYHTIAQDFVYPDPRKLLIFLDNHDISRFADDLRGNAERVKLGITMLATLRGTPQLYYGTELMFSSENPEGGDGPARVGFPGGWKEDRKDMFTGKGRSRRESEVFEHTRKLFRWRKTATALHNGKTVHFLPYGNVYCYFRQNEDQTVMVIINASDKRRDFDWNRVKEMTEGLHDGLDIVSGTRIEVDRKLTLPRRSSMAVDFSMKGEEE